MSGVLMNSLLPKIFLHWVFLIIVMENSVQHSAEGYT